VTEYPIIVSLGPKENITKVEAVGADLGANTKVYIVAVAEVGEVHLKILLTSLTTTTRRKAITSLITLTFREKTTPSSAFYRYTRL
jgi:hypothetical protein